jgi:hypothetical protein
MHSAQCTIKDYWFFSAFLRRYLVRLEVDSNDRGLDRVDFGFIEVNLSTLLADKGRHLIKQQVIAFAVDVKWRDALHHFSLAVNTFHIARAFSVMLP